MATWGLFSTWRVADRQRWRLSASAPRRLCHAYRLCQQRGLTACDNEGGTDGFSNRA
jgi:hypothetical protein